MKKLMFILVAVLFISVGTIVYADSEPMEEKKLELILTKTTEENPIYQTYGDDMGIVSIGDLYIKSIKIRKDQYITFNIEYFNRDSKPHRISSVFEFLAYQHEGPLEMKFTYEEGDPEPYFTFDELIDSYLKGDKVFSFELFDTVAPVELMIIQDMDYDNPVLKYVIDIEKMGGEYKGRY